MRAAPDIHNLFRPPARLDFHDAAVALITLDDGRYLMQLRDDKPGIFYPDHWGLFGGAIDPGEDAESAVRRELREELDLDAGPLRYFTRFDFDFDCIGAGRRGRTYFELTIASADLPHLRLGEGRLMQPLQPDMLLIERLVPYDSFAIWLHLASRRPAPSSEPTQTERGIP
ncbi:NUDIX domain-containing protein [Methylobacterium sp. NEAU 140]|uniref:NUDIX domain-containing protein n=1 Tax=Methylobacterium sp. NEAU 140 TaxID=3064945 RepID=UPI0027337311|nr:NUDIX domain-containing protein [Methylobacterium sp. NEAU 140]MDP4025871.1 NUDIX domain-containing protein [Methylobacterium sp. NEAU 140]